VSGDVNWREPQVVCIGDAGGSVINYEDYEALQRHAKWWCVASAVAAQANRHVLVEGWRGKYVEVRERGQANG
jgi:hypothetical protein